MTISMQHLYRFPLFAGLGDSFTKELQQLGEEVSLKTGEILFDEGDRATAIYVIISGAIDLRMSLDAEGIDKADLERAIEGDTVGWSAMIEPHEYTLQAVAASDTRLLKFNAPRLFLMLEREPEAGFKMMYRLAEICRKRLGHMHVRIASLTRA